MAFVPILVFGVLKKPPYATLNASMYVCLGS